MAAQMGVALMVAARMGASIRATAVARLAAARMGAALMKAVRMGASIQAVAGAAGQKAVAR